MTTNKRIKILSSAEIDDLYAAPAFSENDQRFFFTLNDAEKTDCSRVRNRQQKCMFVVLLGYFKSKPVPINPKYGQIKEDLKFVANTILPGQGLRPFKLAQRDKDRLYSRIFELLGHSTWKEKDHQEMLSNTLFEQTTRPQSRRSLSPASSSDQ
jgi:hypothetical protein